MIFTRGKNSGQVLRHSSGQALLITIMLLAVALTVILAMSYTSKTDTQLSKLEEENQQALAAAEAGIDALVNKPSGNSIVIKDLDASLGNFSGSAQKSAVQKIDFASPLIQSNNHYMLYLSSYPGFGSPYDGNVTLYYSTKSSCTDASADALEITVISGTSYPYTITRYLSDGGNRIISGATEYESAGSYSVDSVGFTCKTKAILISSATNPKIMIARSIFNPTRIGFEGLTPLSAQGTIITSEAKTPSGVSKKIQLFQSYPQIPADFFTTSF